MKKTHILFIVIIIAALILLVVNGNKDVNPADVLTNDQQPEVVDQDLNLNLIEEVEEEAVEPVTQDTVLEDGSYTISSEQSLVAWLGKKKLVQSTHTGTFPVSAGSLEVVEGKLDSGSLTMDIENLQVTDSSGDSLAGHLKNEDFFNVSEHPTAQFTFDSITMGDVVTLNGQLTMKGVTKPVAVPVTLEATEGNLLVSGMMEIDRTQWDITFGSDSFFQGLGDNVIDDMVQIDFVIDAQKA